MEDEIFIDNIHIEEILNIKDFSIKLSNTERKHLILTGKNGSGKTTLLSSMRIFLENVFSGQYNSFSSQKATLNNIKFNIENFSKLERDIQNKNTISGYKKQLDNLTRWLDRFGGLELQFNQDKLIVDESKKGNFLIAYFDAKRHIQLQIPNGINKVNIKQRYAPAENASNAFIQYIVNLKAERSFARDDGDTAEVERIDKWFTRFEKRLKDIFEEPSLKLVFDRKNYNFILQVDNKDPYTLAQLSDGHSAILKIITELILRMESIESGNYNMQGIVLIDEIETHLHVDLQKKILPFLSDFFPNIQFIITTHSPFILSSIENAVICDLQNKIITEDLSGYSYDALIESYFSSDKYSKILHEKLERFEQLSEELKDNERGEFIELEKYFSHLPRYISPELDVKLQQIELNKLSKKRD